MSDLDQVTIGVSHHDELYYKEAQRIWDSKRESNNQNEMNRRFDLIQQQMHDYEQLLKAAFRHIEELRKKAGI